MSDAPTAPQPWPPPPPAVRRSLGWVWVVVALVLVLVLSTAGLTLWFVSAIKPPIDTMNRYLSDVQRHDATAAYALLCRKEQAATPKDEFTIALPVLAARWRNYFVYSFDPLGDARSVHFHARDGTGRRATYGATLVHEQGTWRVCGVFS
jgi:hypothetical protein